MFSGFKESPVTITSDGDDLNFKVMKSKKPIEKE
jgi:hypothetical protein